MPDQNYFIHPTAVADPGCQVGEGTKIWHFCHLMTGCVIGKDCILGQNVFVAAKVILGNNVKVQNNVSLYDGVTCEEGVFIGPSVVFTNISNPRSLISRKNEYQETRIQTGATIGANATVVCGNEIGRYAFVGAGAVVTKPVLPYALVMGNPAVQKGWVSESGHPLHFENGRAVCPESDTEYQLINNTVVKLQ